MSSYTQWVPFRMAARLRCLQQGTLNVGNTQQNIASLLAAAITNANGTRTWAKWKAGFGPGVGGAPGNGNTNYLKQSQTFATAPWVASNTTMANAVNTAPDGTTTGCTMLETAATTAHSVSQNNTALPLNPNGSAQVFTFSVYINPNLTRTWACLKLTDNNAPAGTRVCEANYNLSGNGSLGTNTDSQGSSWANISASIVPAANGWYRCSLTALSLTGNTSIACTVHALTGDLPAGTTTYLGVTSDGLSLWGGQLQYGGVSAYIPTVGAVVSTWPNNTTGLLIKPASVPGFVKPIAS